MGALLLLAACGGRSADKPKTAPHGAAYPQAPPTRGPQPQPRPYANDQAPDVPPVPAPVRPAPGVPVPGPGIQPPPLERPFASPEEAERAVEADERDLLSLLEADAFRAASASQCTTACRALASMRRSVDGLCRLAGDVDERCTSARKRLAEAGERVRAAGCACTNP